MNNNNNFNVNSWIGSTHQDFFKTSSNMLANEIIRTSNILTNEIITTSNILESHLHASNIANSNYTYISSNQIVNYFNKMIDNQIETITIPINYNKTHTYITNSNLVGEIRFWVKSAGDYPVVVPFGVPDYRTKIDADGKLKIYYTFDPLISATFGNGWIDVATSIVNLNAADINMTASLVGIQGEITNNYNVLEAQIIQSIFATEQVTIMTDFQRNQIVQSVQQQASFVRAGQQSMPNALATIRQSAFTGLPQYLSSGINAAAAIVVNNPFTASFLGATGAVFYFFLNKIYEQEYNTKTLGLMYSNVSVMTGITETRRTELYSNILDEKFKTYANILSNEYFINLNQGFLNSNIQTPQTLSNLNAYSITLNGQNVNNIFLSQNGGSMYNSLVFQKNTSGNPIAGFFDGPGSRVIYEPSTTTLDYACSMGINNTTKNMWFSASSNYGYQWWVNGLNVMSLSSSGNLTINNGSITEERQYPPKAYTSSTNEAVITYLGQSGMLFGTITLNPIGITYGFGIYELYSSSRYNATQYQKRDLFNYATTTNEVGGHWSGGQYNEFGVYNGVAYIKPDYLGDFLVVKIPNPIILTRFRFYPRLGLNFRIPGEFKFYGSMNGIDFTEITQASQITPRLTTNDIVNGYYEKTLAAGFTTPYLYIGFAVNKLMGTSGFPDSLNFQEFQIFGKEVISNTASFNGVGSFITELDYNNITLNKPATFPPTMTNIYSKTETDTFLNTKQNNLTFQSPLINTANTITLSTTNLITTAGGQTINGSLTTTGTITENGKTIPTIAQETILNSTPRVAKKIMITGTCSSSILMPDGFTYFAYDIDLRTYTQTKTAPNPSTPYRIFNIKVFFGSVYFGYLTNNKPNVLSYEVYMSNESQGGGGGIGSAGLNVCAIGYPENVILNAISPTQLSLVCGDFNFISILSRINGTVFNAIIEDCLA